MKTDFHNKDFALSLDLKRRLRWTQEWPIVARLLSGSKYLFAPFYCIWKHYHEREGNADVEVKRQFTIDRQQVDSSG